MEEEREVCLQEEVERRRQRGMSAAEIAQDMGVAEGWVEQLLSMSAEPSKEG